MEMSKSIENLLVQLTADENVPTWATAIISSIKLIFEEHESTNQELIRRIDLLESEKSICKTVTDRLNQEIIRLQTQMNTALKGIDDNEQYSRRNCLLIHGVKETDK